MIRLILIGFIFGVTNSFSQVKGWEDIPAKIRPAFDLTDYRVSGDTLTIISSARFLYYPLGYFSNANKLKSTYPDLYAEKGARSYLFQGSSYVKFFFDEEKQLLEVIYARIFVPELKLTNGTYIGMQKKDLFNKFFLAPPDNIDKVNVLVLESALVGIWHYYFFDKDLLKSVILDTDYQDDKD